MPKFYGPIGFVETIEKVPGSGVWDHVVEERNYRGDIVKNYKRLDNGEHLNSNIDIRNTISIVADPYIMSKLYAIHYIKWLGGYWTINSVDVQPPRLILDIGGVYNGPRVECVCKQRSEDETPETFGENPRFD